MRTRSFLHRPAAIALALTGLTSLTAQLGASEHTSGVGPTERDAVLYCEDAASRLQILAEDKESFMVQCTDEYLASPPGDIGVSPEPGSTGY